MKNLRTNYETLIKITRSLSKSRDPEELIQMTVDSIKSALGIKGCTLFLMNRRSKELEVAASTGLSDEYLNKGAISALRSIAESLRDGPVAVYDAIDAVRVYTAEKWEFTLDDVNFVQALAQIAGILIEMARLYQGQSEHIQALADMCESPAL